MLIFKDAIKEVFNQYGKISGMCYPPNATWAYITYKSYREAELAIRELNNKKPLYLKVALAKERSVIREEKLPKSYVSESFGGRPRAIDTLAEPSISIHNDMKQYVSSILLIIEMLLYKTINIILSF